MSGFSPSLIERLRKQGRVYFTASTTNKACVAQSSPSPVAKAESVLTSASTPTQPPSASILSSPLQKSIRSKKALGGNRSVSFSEKEREGDKAAACGKEALLKSNEATEHAPCDSQFAKSAQSIAPLNLPVSAVADDMASSTVATEKFMQSPTSIARLTNESKLTEAEIFDISDSPPSRKRKTKLGSAANEKQTPVLVKRTTKSQQKKNSVVSDEDSSDEDFKISARNKSKTNGCSSSKNAAALKIATSELEDADIIEKQELLNSIKEKEETILLLQEEIKKRPLDELQSASNQWRSVAQEVIEELRQMEADPKPSLLKFLRFLNIDFKLIHYDENNDAFY